MQIKIVDDRGHTVCIFGRLPAIEAGRMTVVDKEIEYPAMPERWMTMPKPFNRRRELRNEAELTEHNIWVNRHPVARPVRFNESAEPTRLELPGLTLRWHKVTAILDRLAENFEGDTLTLTVDQFRECVR